MNTFNLLTRISAKNLRKIFVLSAFVFTSLISNKAQATHAAGADLTYKCLGGLQYEIEVTFYRDCGGVAEPSTITVNYSSVSGGYTLTATANKISGTGQEITVPCQSSASTCNGGSSTGVRKFVYRATVTLPAAKTDWVFSYNVCCRNCAITTIQNPCANSTEIYVEAKLNNVAASCNSSPTFSNIPVAFVCIGQTFNFNHGVLDVDGDSLSYSLIAPKISASTNVTFISPNSATLPVQSSTPFTCNAVTGSISFTPTQQQIGILAVLVKEYRNGVLIGSTIRDMQVYTVPCTNNLPTASGINNSANFNLNLCPNATTCFDIYTADADASQNVTITTNLSQSIPGASYTITSGSRPSLHFCWTPTNADINLLPNTFTISVQDNACPNNGVQTFSYNIYVPSPYFNVTSSNVTCFGLNNGTATAAPVYSGSYMYSWNTIPVKTTASVTGLGPGTYTVTVTDASSCTSQQSVTITSPPQLTVNNAITNVACNGVCSGAINQTLTGGTSPFTFNWSGGNGSTEDLSSKCAGSYSCTITEANGCTTVKNYTISQPAALSVSNSKTNVNCFGGNTGSINLTIGGGTTPYTYAWSNGATTQNLSSIAAGTYTVTVKDANNCTSSQTISISQPTAALSSSVSATNNVSCFGGTNGSVNLNVTGGTTPYTYQWNNGATTQNISGLSSGNYTVTVTDANACTSTTASISITQPTAALSASAGTITSVSCFGGSNGSVNLNVNGGTSPYSYAWSNGATTQNLAGAVAGTYTVTVTDAHNCTATAAGISVTQPAAALNNTISSSSNVSCFGGSNGSIDLTVSGGTSPYSYNWSTGANSQDLTGIAAGNYTVTVTDARGCTAVSSGITINQPGASLSSSVNGTNNVSCFGGGNGSITLNVNGGTAPYSYNWSNGANSQNISNLAAGSYSVTITDAQGCTTQNNAISITQPGAALNGSVIASSDVLCFGGNSGSITLSVNGGTTPYSYNWSNGATTQNLPSIVSGNYSVTVTDSHGCTNAVNGIVISQPSGALASSVTHSNVNCRNESTASINLTVNGGTTPYSYNWSNSATTQNLLNIVAGTYTVTVTDANGCSTTSSSITVTQPSGILAGTILTTANVSCNSGANGALDLTVSGGTGPYSYVWSNGSLTQDINGLFSGNYVVTITDANGCTTDATGIVSQPAGALNSSINTSQNVSCFGGTNGSINLTVAGGTTPYTYTWSNGSTSQDISNLTSGSYTVTVNDANGCINVSTAVVDQPVAALANSISNISSVLCFGGNTGSVDLTVTGGTPPYSYNWSNSATTQDLNAIVSGNYSVTVTDANGCTTQTNSITVDQPAGALNASASGITNVACFGGINGAINLSVSGGTGPYSFNWSTGANTQNINNILAGNYSVTVTDANGCTRSVNAITVDQPAAALNASVASTTPVSCFGGTTGAITLTINGGTTPYSYNWSNGATSQNLSNINAGNYVATVTDAHGCTVQTSAISITQPGAALNANTSTVGNVNCFGGTNGNINLAVAGGTSPYSYTWSNGSHSQNLSGLPAGTYSVTVTDANGCTDQVAGITVDQPSAALNSSVSNSGNVNCFGGNNGNISLTISGGTTPYSYQWNNGATTQNISSLIAGNYSVTITDAQGCTIQNNAISITQPGAALNSLVSTTGNVNCFGGNNGNINLTVNGGTSPYSFNWSNGANTEDLTGLTAGNYSVTITDANGCTTNNNGIAITQPGAALNSIVESVHNVNCFGGSNGTIGLNVSGGTAPYSYNWSNGATTAFLSNVSSGTYSVTITDAQGCTTQITGISISQPAAALNSSVNTSGNVNCFGGSNGSINLNVNGGTSPYAFSWSNGALTQNLTNIPAGTYSVTITDVQGCTTTINAITITQPAASLNSSVGSTTNISCFGGSNGGVNLTVSGGTTPYSYNWSNGTTSQNLSGAIAGTYSVTITDANGCTTQNNAITLTQPAGVLAANTSSVSAVSCFGGNNGSVFLNVTGGTIPYSFQWSNNATTQNITNISVGNYTVTVTDAHGCSTTISEISVVQPPAALSAATNATNNVGCFGANTGAINLVVVGGTSPYFYNWSNSATTQNLSNIPAGLYSVTVTDANGCTNAVTGIAITQPGAALNANTSSTTNVGCFAGNTGAINLNVNGGTTPYNYNWSNGATTQNISNIGAGNYSVTITDANGCTKSVSGISITQPGGALAGSTATTQNVSCNSGANGAIDLTITGGTSPYSYNWSNGATTQDINGLFAGSYIVTVTDANGCTANINGIVSQPAGALSSSINSSVNILCFAGNNGSVNLAISGGTAPYAYNWSNGATTQNINGLTAGTYTCTISDANGCIAVSTAMINQPTAALNSSVTSTGAVLCFGGNSGSIDLNVIGGTAPYSYSWSNGSTTQDLSGVVAGNYSVNVTDANGCTTQTNAITVSQPGGALNAGAGSTTNVSCFGGTNGGINLTVGGGTSPYTYAWSNGANTQNITNIGAGTYSVTVTDANGCTIAVNAITINQPAASLNANTGSTNNVSCFGGTNGSINLTVTGGTTPYSFSWSNGATTQNISNISAGNYAATVTDAHGCTIQTSAITISQPGAALSANTSAIGAVNCFGGATGSINLTVTGGTGPYSYNWSNGATTQNITAISSGNYSVTVTDLNGCTDNINGIAITQPGASLNSSVGSSININCFGGNTGSINLNVSGGTTPYNFIWSNGATTQNISGINAGTYSVSITDANGCTTQSNGIAITQPGAALTTSVSSTGNVNCFGGNNGSINLNVAGGTSPYSYSWSNGATTQNLSGIIAGSYSVSVIDANGCTTQNNAITITQPGGALTSSIGSSGNVNCFGGNNGNITLNVSGGTIPYSYNWSNGATTQNITSLTAGSYSVTITDANGCTTQTNAITITQPGGALTSSVSSSGNVNCFGGSNGNINLNVAGGTSPYSFNWSNGSNTQNLSNIPAGSYSVTVTDAQGCTTQINAITISQPGASLNASVSTTSAVSCFGGGNGNINIGVTGGTSPYSYNWSNGATTQNLSNISAGNYTVVITDANGCITDIGGITITEPAAALSGTTATTQNVSCNSGANGSIDLTISGGTIPYSFNWSNGATTEDINGLLAGNYVVTVTDNNGCTAIINGIVSQPVGALSSSVNATDNVLCFAGNNGSIDLNVNGGTAPYAYNWSNGSNTQDLSNLGAGTFTCTITDANGCLSVATAVITQPAAALSGNAGSTTNVSCFGGTNGGITLNVNGGTSPYSYNWSNGATTQNISGLSAGQYSVTVTDANGCSTEVTSIAIDQPAAALNSNVSNSGNVNCFGGSNGAINLNVAGGTSPYSFNWSNGATTQNISGLAAGNYSVTITDANGCTDVVNAITITQPGAALNAGVSGNTPVSCFGGNNGSISLSVNGGTGPYSYQWSNGDTTQNLANISSGSYSVTITDAQGCTTAVNAINVTQPGAGLSANANSMTPVSCFGGTNGGINLTVSGGTTPYSYNWSNGSTTQNLNGVGAGTYSVTVTDVNGCTIDVNTLTISQPAAQLIGQVNNSGNVNCFGGSNGNITLLVTGGTAPYSYNWSNGSTTQDLSNLSAGNYSVTITDANGCTTDINAIAITQPAASLSSNVGNSNPVSCFGGNTGSINLNVTGGTAPYSYNWSNGSTTQNLSNLTAGNYSVTVTDDNGCTIQNNGIAITQPGAAISGTAATTQNVSCNSGANGSVDLTVTGGTSPYTFAWSNGSTTEDINGLFAGNYVVTITDANGCTEVVNAQVTQPAGSLGSSAQVNQNVLCFGGVNGAIDLTATGGTAPYSYNWSNGATTEDISNLASGTYVCTITDANGCLSQSSAFVSQPAGALSNSLNASQQVSCFGGNNGSIDLTVTGGTAPYSYNWSNGSNIEDLANLSAGTYTVTITDANGCSGTGSVAITQPQAALSSSASTAQNVSCFGGSNGIVDLTVTGGTAPYTFNWSNGMTTQNISGIPAGVYTAIITDANGCTGSATSTVIEPQASVSATIGSLQNVLCYGGSSGIIDITLTGGTAPYLYNWSNGATTEDINGVAVGTYTCTITDANGCTTDLTQTLTQPTNALSGNTVVSQIVSCFGGNNGALDLTVQGGTAPYTYNWSNGTTTEDIANLTPGNYTVTITDANGCTSIVNANLISPPSVIVANTVPTSINCFDVHSGSISLNVSGGVPPYTYQWSNGLITQNISGLGAGTYTVTVTDSNGCFTTSTATITQPLQGLALASAAITDVLCQGQATGTIDITVVGGTPPYSYNWSTGATTQDLSGVMAGTYTVTITDSLGCIRVLTQGAINEPDSALMTNIASAQNVLCFGASTGSIDLSAIGGTYPYSYSWSNGSTTQDISNLSMGAYTVTTTDANGCTSVNAVSISSPATAINLALVPFMVNCFDHHSGAINLTVVGGTGPYSYQWSNFQTTEDLSGLGAGTYTVTVTDANGCTQQSSTTLVQPLSGLMISSSNIQNVLCKGGASGNIDITVQGGTAPYTYQWSNGSTTQDITGLTTGTYTVTITDSLGCVRTLTQAAVTEPDSVLSASAIAQAVGCINGGNGSINLTAIGGVAPYTYSWSTGVTTEDISGLQSGTYTVTVTDANGCTTNVSSAITQPTAAVTISGSTTPAGCLASNGGTVTINVNGGTPGYSFLWSNNATTQDLTGVSAGTYTVTVTDANGCSSSYDFIVTDQSVLNAQSEGPTEFCVGNFVTLFVPNFQGATYQWYQNGQPLVGSTQSYYVTPAAGIFYVTVTNSCGSFTSDSIEVIVHSLDSVSVSPNVIICPNLGEVAYLHASGGVSYVWAPDSGLNSPNIANPIAVPPTTTNYQVYATDQYGCTAKGEVLVSVVCDTLFIPTGFSPDNNSVNDTYVIDGLDKYPGNKLYIYNRWGQLVYKAKDYQNNWDGSSNVGGAFFGKQLPNGTYFYILDLNNNSKPLQGYLTLKR